MICPYCRSQNIEGADECAHCGQSLTGIDLPGAKSSGPSFIHQLLEALPQHPVVTVDTSDPVGLAVRRMQTGDTGAVLVLQNGLLAGIITSWDILHKVAGARDDLNAVTCRQIMTPDPIVFHYDDSLALAINKMSSGEFRHIPIISNDRPVSVLDVNDVFRHISMHLV